MKGNISIIYIKTSQLSEEKIAVGAIGIFGSKVDIVISDEKLNFSFNLLQGKNKSFVIQNLNFFQNKINDINIQSKKDTGNLNISVDLDKNYLSYLNAYSQGLIAFGAPMPINIPSDDANYYRDFMKKFIGKFPKTRNLNRIHLIGKDFLKEVSVHAIKVSKDKIALQKVIEQNTIGELYELIYLLNALKTKLKSAIEIEVGIIVDNNSNLSTTELAQLLKNFNFAFIKTELSKLEVGLVKNVRIEGLLKEVETASIA